MSLFIYFSVVRTVNMTFTFLSLTNLKVEICITYGHYVVQQISRIYSSSVTENLYSLNNKSPFPPPLTIVFSTSMSLTV